MPTTGQLVGTVPMLAVEETDVPFKNQIAVVPVVVSRHSRSCLAVAVEVALADDRPVGGHRAKTSGSATTCAPFISQIATVPLLCRQAMSLLPSPLKSWLAGREPDPRCPDLALSHSRR